MNQVLDPLLPLIVGGSLGTLSRYYLALWTMQWNTGSFPLGTFTVNIVGSLLMGILAAMAESQMPLSPATRLLLMTGFLGAFTTFSAYEFDIFYLLKSGEIMRCVLYAGGSVIVGLLVFGAGYQAGKGILA